MRGVGRPSRYGLKGLLIANKELVRLHNLISTRVHQVLQLLTKYGASWAFEAPALRDGEVCSLRLDEYAALFMYLQANHVI